MQYFSEEGRIKHSLCSAEDRLRLYCHDSDGEKVTVFREPECGSDISITEERGSVTAEQSDTGIVCV